MHKFVPMASSIHPLYSVSKYEFILDFITPIAIEYISSPESTGSFVSVSATV